MEYSWFSFLLIGLLLLFILLTIILRNKRIVAGILVSLATIILIWKTIEFSYYAINHTGTYPIEISHISYFVFGVIILSGLTKFYFTAGIFGFISGLGYMVAGIVSPASVVTSLPTHLFVMGIISHMILLFGGMLTLFSFTKYEMKRFYFPLIGLVLVFIFAYLVDQKYIYPEATGLNNLVVIRMINWDILSYLGIDSTNHIINVIATIGIYLLVIILVILINLINNKIFKNKPYFKHNFDIYRALSNNKLYKAN